METDAELVKGDGCETGPGCSGYSSMVHSKKVIKHALRQQAKRRRKNTTIAAGNSRTLPRIVVKPLPPPPPNDPPSPANNVQHVNTAEEPAATMREVLASLPGFSLKSGRRRSTKKLSATAQLEAGLVDLESPASILANTSLRALLNRHTFQGLPPLYQRKLAQLLPAVDRQDAATSGLNNEFFARACLEWRKRLAEGEFTPENQQRLKMEAERDKNKLDPWKVKHFEPIWGEKREPKLRSGFHCITESRSSGAVTRSSQRLRMESNIDTVISDHNHCPVIIAEDNAETDSCKVETNANNSDELVQNRVNQRDPSPLQYDEIVQNLTDQQILDDCLNINSIDVPVHTESKEEIKDEEISTVKAEQETTEHNEVVNDVCQNRMESVYEGDDQPQESEKNVQIVDDHIPSMPEEDTILLPEDNSSPRSNEQLEHASHASRESVSQLSKETVSTPSMDDRISEITIEQIPQVAENEIYQMSDCQTTTVLGNSSPDSKVETTDIVMDDSGVVNSTQLDANQVSQENPTDGESQFPEGMEIDGETLQRIHELEVRGEMRETYEQMSGCPEEIMYSIFDGMEMSSNDTAETETRVVQEQVENVREQQDINAGNEDDALRDANNYAQEEVQVPWPLVAAALDGSVAANITVTTQDECNEVATTTEPANASQQFVTADASMDSVNCIQLPAVQGTPFQSEGLAIGTPGTNCIMKNLQSQSPPIIAFPQLQSIRFVQTSFHSDQSTMSALNTTTAISGQLQNQQNPAPQVNVIRAQEEVLQLNTQNGAVQNSIRNGVAQNQVQNTVSSGIAIQAQNRAQDAIIVQQQTTVATQPRQIVATIQQQQQYPGTVMTVSSRSSRSVSQGNQRGSRNSNKEQGGRSRSTTKEPPGAVNLERSYQICQAVIQSSPNRDQLKAHLKPPPSLLARGDSAFTTNKSGGRTITTVKAQKQAQQTLQHAKQAQTKTQAVMLRHVFATTRHTASAEVAESNTVAHLGTTTASGLGQYILVQRTGVGDGAPRASSAPPLPPQITGMGVGVHLVRGRPASAGEGSHQAVTLKARGADGRGSGGAEPGAPGMIMGGDPPPPCECNMRGAMVICRQCGAFCHDDCIGPQRICATCLIR